MTDELSLNPPVDWWVYFIETKDSALYCGITNDVEQRFELHNAGKGAKYLRGKRPLTLKWSLSVGDKSTAAKLEYRLKRVSSVKKRHIIKSVNSLDGLYTLFPDWPKFNQT